MNKHSRLMRLTAFMVVLTMMIGVVGMGYSEEPDVTEPPAETEKEVTTPEPTATPTPEPTATPTPEPTATPTPEPTATPTPEPTATPTPEPTATPTPEPTATPTPEPTATPTPEPTATPTPEPTATPTPEPTATPTPEPTATPEPEATEKPTEKPTPEPTEVPESTVVTQLEQKEESKIEEPPADDDEDDAGEDYTDIDDDDLVEFDDDDPGAVSEDLLQQFNNPDNFEQVEFSGSADIELRNAEGMWGADWDGKVTLVARVRDANLSYRLVWEANDHDDRGWFTVGNGEEYSYTLTRENADREAKREYRVVLYTVD